MPELNGRVLVTGADGFVGRHLLAELGERAVATSVDVTDAEELARAVRAVRPAAVAHLAALSSVGESWRDRGEVWRVNVLGTVNLLDAVAALQPRARLLVVSTGDVYGRPHGVPTREDEAVAPVSPYAASKAAAEIACEQERRATGLDIVVARAFAHIGPGQDERFAVGSWTRQIARLEATGGGALRVGDLSVKRDLTDVRDVCRAYRLLLDPAVPAGTYNVASGRAVALADLVRVLVDLARAPISVERDEGRFRPADVPVICGDPSLLTATTGWKPEIPLDTTLADALAEARHATAETGAGA
ncbi:MAG: GDP-mannose 4,6-dehydratase [Actinomycetota bacterium]|nr:GDP-mannose 4,6-dehydratase [Actinomycetota bacterium]